jgi:hypothetical protein
MPLPFVALYKDTVDHCVVLTIQRDRLLRVAKEYERVAELTQERAKRWRGKTYGMCAAFCTAFAAATVRCGVGTSIDVLLLSG